MLAAGEACLASLCYGYGHLFLAKRNNTIGPSLPAHVRCVRRLVSLACLGYTINYCIRMGPCRCALHQRKQAKCSLQVALPGKLSWGGHCCSPALVYFSCVQPGGTNSGKGVGRTWSTMICRSSAPLREEHMPMVGAPQKPYFLEVRSAVLLPPPPPLH